MTTAGNRVASAAEAARAHHYEMAGLNPDGTPIVKDQNPLLQADPEPSFDDQSQLPQDQEDIETLRAEFNKLQRDYNSVVGRVAPLQQADEAARRALLEAQQLQAQRDIEFQRRLAELTAQLEDQKRKTFNPRALLSEDEAAMIDDTQLAAIQKIARAIATQEIAQVKDDQVKEIARVTASFQEQNRRDKIANTLANPQFGLDCVQTKAADPVFNAWLTSDEGIIANQLLTNMLNAPAEDVHRLARAASKELGKFPGHPSKTNQPVTAPTGGDIPNRLAAHAARQSNRVALNDADIQSKIARANELSAMGGSTNLAEARKILDELRNAQALPRS